MLKRVDTTTAIGCAFMFMEKACLTKDEISSYLEILKGLLPEGYILYGKENALDIIEEYEIIKSKDDLYYINADMNAFSNYFLYKTPSNYINIFKDACNILKAVEEMSDEITTKDNISLKKTI